MRRLILMTGKASNHVALWPGERAKILAELAHTQGQLACSYWQLGSAQSLTILGGSGNDIFDVQGLTPATPVTLLRRRLASVGSASSACKNAGTSRMRHLRELEWGNGNGRGSEG